MLDGVYHLAAGQKICDPCRTAVERELASGSKVARVVKAMVFGSLAAIGGAALYVGVAILFKAEIGLVAIAVGLMVGFAVRKGSEGRGGKGYQALAMLLTYSAIIALYVPAAVDRQMDGLKKKKATEASAAEKEGHPDAAEKKSVNPLVWVIALPILYVLACIEPFRQGGGNFIGLLLIGFALYEAWKINRGSRLVFSGPYRLGPPSSGSISGG
jgi:hypothetical protein